MSVVKMKNNAFAFDAHIATKYHPFCGVFVVSLLLVQYSFGNIRVKVLTSNGSCDHTPFTLLITALSKDEYQLFILVS